MFLFSSVKLLKSGTTGNQHTPFPQNFSSLTNLPFDPLHQSNVSVLSKGQTACCATRSRLHFLRSNTMVPRINAIVDRLSTVATFYCRRDKNMSSENKLGSISWAFTRQLCSRKQRLFSLMNDGSRARALGQVPVEINETLFKTQYRSWLYQVQMRLFHRCTKLPRLIAHKYFHRFWQNTRNVGTKSISDPLYYHLVIHACLSHQSLNGKSLSCEEDAKTILTVFFDFLLKTISITVFQTWKANKTRNAFLFRIHKMFKIQKFFLVKGRIQTD